MSNLVPFRKFAVGYDRVQHITFPAMIAPYLPAIKEVYFSWPGMISGRAVRNDLNNLQEKEILLKDLSWCRQNGLILDLLFNANCYGEDAYSVRLRGYVYDIIEELRVYGLFPEVVTTTSQYIAKVIKLRYPEIDIRASVNMRIESTNAMDFISDIFDSFYICRDIQRDRRMLKHFYDWSIAHGKHMCMLVNSGCLRSCPAQIWHDNFLCHNPASGEDQQHMLHYPYRLCQRVLSQPNHIVEYLRMSWIRPEDIHYYEPFAYTMKLATRRTDHPETIVRAYCEGHYEGNVLDFLGLKRNDIMLDNKEFPINWVDSGIAQSCVQTCHECGRCQEVLSHLVKPLKQAEASPYSVTKPPFETCDINI